VDVQSTRTFQRKMVFTSRYLDHTTSSKNDGIRILDAACKADKKIAERPGSGRVVAEEIDRQETDSIITARSLSEGCNDRIFGTT
jgi:hypothetical protein